ncbi:hypothetical protein VSR82_32745 [Burkholderia sp. JPY481]
MAHLLSNATGSEDLLTSLVFERVSYLTDDALSAFWAALLPADVRPFGRIESIEFWPRLELNGGFVEPDVVLVTESALVVVEAKRWDQMDQQYSPQVAQEILAVAKTEPLAKDLPLVLLLVGGRQDTSPEATLAFEALVQKQLVGEQVFSEVEIRAVKWADMLNAFAAIAHLHPGYQRMRDDVAAGLSFHGLVRKPEVRLHELRRANLKAETFALAVATCPKTPSAAATDRPASPFASVFGLTRLNINFERFSFHK